MSHRPIPRSAGRSGFPGTLAAGDAARPPVARARRAVLVVLVIAVSILTGCHTLRFEIVDAPHAVVVHHQKSFYAAGLFPRQQRVDVSQFCPHGVSRVREQSTPDDVAFSLVTLGIYTPRSSWYYCLPGPGEGSDWMVDVPMPDAPEDPPASDPSSDAASSVDSAEVSS